MSEKSAITILAEALADMTAKAVDAEQKAAAEKRRADEWYQYFQAKEAAVNDLSDKLAAEIQEHQQAKRRLSEALGGKEHNHE